MSWRSRSVKVGLAVALAAAMFLGSTPATTAIVPGAPEPDVVGIALQGVLLERVATGLDDPVFATHAGDGSGRLFLVEQPGVIKVKAGASITPYLDLRSKVKFGGEQGLLGLAFHPDFATNGVLFASYTRQPDGASVLEKFTVADPANGKPVASQGQVLLTIAQPFTNHNGGNIVFGPDGYLYFGLGDGGSGGDPQGHGQNPHSLLGKMLRLDVDVPQGYAIPPGNLFPGGAGGRAEICSMGLRNPWRWSFDRATGDLWIADVGQNLIEEINWVPAAEPCGQNYGWNLWEGHRPYTLGGSPPFLPPVDGMTFPVFEYPHGVGCSITGGYVYRGPSVPALDGLYLYGDYCTGVISVAFGAPNTAAATVPILVLGELFALSSFGEDEAGDVYIVSLAGNVYKIGAL